MDSLTANVEWLPTILGAVIAFLVGWLWYSPKLFVVAWLEGVRLPADAGDDMPAAAMIVQAAGTLLLSWVLAVCFVNGALLFAGLIVLTLAAIIASNGLYVQKSHTAIAIEIGYIAVMSVIMVGTQMVV